MDLHYLTSTSTNTNDIPKIDFCYLARALTNTNDILKVDSCHLTRALTSTNNKANNFIKKEFDCV